MTDVKVRRLLKPSRERGPMVNIEIEAGPGECAPCWLLCVVMRGDAPWFRCHAFGDLHACSNRHGEFRVAQRSVLCHAAEKDAAAEAEQRRQEPEPAAPEPKPAPPEKAKVEKERLFGGEQWWLVRRIPLTPTACIMPCCEAEKAPSRWGVMLRQEAECDRFLAWGDAPTPDEALAAADATFARMAQALAPYATGGTEGGRDAG